MSTLALLKDFAATLKKARKLTERLPADWNAMAHRADELGPKDQFSAVVIGAGIGGLATAAFLTRHGFKVTVLEKHFKAGGYATNFKRDRGRFMFEVSLHTMTIDGNPTGNILRGLGVFDKVKFNALPEYHRLVTPDHDMSFPAADAANYKRMLIETFPEEERAIHKIVDTLTGIGEEILALDERADKFIPLLFPFHFPKMWSLRNLTLQQFMDKHTRNAELQGFLGVLWSYYGLPPSKLSAFFYAAGTGDYIAKGGSYPEGSSQALSDALVEIIEERGGRVLLKTEAKRIIIEGGTAVGVEDHRGTVYPAQAVVSNTSAIHTFKHLTEPEAVPGDYRAQLDSYEPSDSSFTVWLGLNRDITEEIKEAEIFLLETCDLEQDYEACLAADPSTAGLVINFYDNMGPGFTPEGKSAMAATFLCGYEPWARFEADYRKREKKAYRAEKERIADIVIDRIERRLIPGLREMIEIKEIGSPLTNVRYTGNPRGAIYGYAMAMNNAFLKRNDNRTPVDSLYLAGAWGTPGGGYTGCLRSAQQTWRCIIEDWERRALSLPR
jgi:prolycopene isomerase